MALATSIASYALNWSVKPEQSLPTVMLLVNTNSWTEGMQLYSHFNDLMESPLALQPVAILPDHHSLICLVF